MLSISLSRRKIDGRYLLFKPLAILFSNLFIRFPLQRDKRDPRKTRTNNLSIKTLNTMCRGYAYVHFECRHEKKFKILQYCPEHTRGGQCTLDAVQYRKVTSPSLCVSCFRAKEAEIDASYHTRVGQIRRHMAEHEATQDELQVRGRAQGAVDDKMAQFERDIVLAKEGRDARIRSFRQQQNVWGDG